MTAPPISNWLTESQEAETRRRRRLLALRIFVAACLAGTAAAWAFLIVTG